MCHPHKRKPRPWLFLRCCINLKDLVTKEDLRHEVELLRRDMHDMEQRLVIKLGSLMAFSIGIVAALVKLL